MSAVDKVIALLEELQAKAMRKPRPTTSLLASARTRPLRRPRALRRDMTRKGASPPPSASCPQSVTSSTQRSSRSSRKS